MKMKMTIVRLGRSHGGRSGKATFDRVREGKTTEEKGDYRQGG